MAQFYGEMQGTRGEVSRCGSKNIGLVAHVRGWDVGAKIYMSHDNGKDVCEVYSTCGSHKPQVQRLIVRLYEDGEVEFHGK